jgi:hypothetical protein
VSLHGYTGGHAERLGPFVERQAVGWLNGALYAQAGGVDHGHAFC